MKHDKQWFIERIGKRIFLENNHCPCAICVDVFENGLIIDSNYMAQFFFDCQNQMGMIYSDKKLDTNRHEQRQ